MSTPATADPLLAWREEFPILAQTNYLVSHSLGAMPRSAAGALAEYAATWQARGVRAWHDAWWEMPAAVADELGGLFGAPPGSVSMHANATLAEAVFLSCFDWRGPRNRLVTTDLDFPSMLYLYDGLAAQGAEIVRVPSSDGRTIDPARLRDAVDERAAVVAFSHVLFKTGAIVDPAPVVEKARAVGAVTLLDAYQSVGVLPLDVSALGVDAVAGGSVKWLCGGPGAGYLYVRPELARGLRPRITGWFAHREPFAFAPPPMAPAEGPFRFLNGTTNVPALYAAREGYRILRGIEVSAVRTRSLQLTERLFRAAEARGWTVHTPRAPEARGGTVVIGVPDAERVCADLERREILVDHRPGVGLRFGPHFYNTEDEVDRAVQAVDAILAGGGRGAR